MLISNTTEPHETARYVWECAGGNMYRAAYDILGNRADTEDAVMDAMYRIVRNEDKFTGLPDADIRALAAIYARNTAIDLYRKNRHQAYPEEELPEEADFSASPEFIVTEADAAQRLLQLIGQMPPSYRDVLLLRIRYGMNDREIARTLGIRGGTVRTRMSRARDWLEKNLHEKGENE
jgi:RNA polymerase sigma-70 factor (ECF subfamily)